MSSLLYIAILPVVLLLSYIYKKDTHKEPTKVLVKTFAFGVLIVIPAVILEIILAPFFSTEKYKSLYMLFINILIGIAFIEEILKWLVIKLSIYKDERFDESFDGIIYAVFASLGFATIENVLYVLSDGIGVGIARALTSIPLHTCTGVLMGYAIGKAKLYQKNNNKKQENKYIALSIILPITVHTIYDFLALAKRVDCLLILLVFIITIYIICFITIKKSTINNISITGEQELTKGEYCKNCGTKIDHSEYCHHCGTKNT